MSAREKIAYLKGLLDGVGPAENEGLGKIFGAVVEALEALSLDIAEQEEMINDQRELYEDLADDCALLDEDLDTLEKKVAELTDEDDDFDSDDEPDYEQELNEGDFDESYVSVTCPKCGYVFYYQQDEYEEDEPLECPGCGESFPQPAEE